MNSLRAHVRRRGRAVAARTWSRSPQSSRRCGWPRRALVSSISGRRRSTPRRRASTTARGGSARARPRRTPREARGLRLVSEAAESGLDTVVARVFNPIGPRMPPTSLPGRAARLLRDAVVEGAPDDRARSAGCRAGLRRPPRHRDGRAWSWRPRPRLAHRVYNVGSGRRDGRQGSRGDDRRPARVHRGDPRIIGRDLRDRTTSAARSPTSRACVRRDGCRAVELAASVDALVAGIVEGSSR